MKTLAYFLLAIFLSPFVLVAMVVAFGLTIQAIILVFPILVGLGVIAIFFAFFLWLLSLCISDDSLAKAVDALNAAAEEIRNENIKKEER